MRSFLHVLSSRLVRGFLILFILVGTVAILASSASASSLKTVSDLLAAGENQLTVIFQAPLFEITAQNQIKLLSETDRYSYTQPEGVPLLPHRSYNLGLPPDADFTSLELQVEDVQMELLPGLFQVPLASPPLWYCAPAQGQSVCRAPGAAPAIASPDELLAWLRLPQKITLDGLRSLFPAAQILRTQPERVETTGVTLPSTGQLRKWRFARLEFSPFIYNPQTGRMSVIRAATARVFFRRDPALVTPKILADTVMDDYAPLLIDNFADIQPLYESAKIAARQAIADQPQVTYDYLILTTSAIYQNSITTGVNNHTSNLETYINFLNEHGHNVWYQFVEDLTGYTGMRADRMRAYLIDVHNAWPSIKYVLLVGDPDPLYGDVPMRRMYPNHLTHPASEWERVPTDAYYSNLTGNWDLNGNYWPGEGGSSTKAGDIGPGGLDFTPTVFVGRIPVYNADYAGLNHILDKLIAYQNMTQRQAWQDQALLTMTFHFTDSDNAVLGEVLNTNLLAPNSITSHRIYMNHPNHPWTSACNQVSAFTYDEAVGNDVVVNYWKVNPVGLMVWGAHGGYDRVGVGFGPDELGCWETYNLFDNQDVHALNDAQPAFTYLMACDNAEPEQSSNIAYSLLRHGAVATVGGTRVVGGNDLDTIEGIPTNYHTPAGLGYNYIKYLIQGYSAGEALLWAKALYTMGPEDIMQNFFAYNLYGDPSLVFIVPPYSGTLNPPTGLYAEPLDAGGHQLFKLHWNENSGNDEYNRITLSPTDLSGDVVVDVGRNSQAASVLSYTTCGKGYNIQVQAVNRSNFSAPSNIITVNADPCEPAAPSNLTAALDGSHVVLHWMDNADNEAGYKIYRYWAGYPQAEYLGELGINGNTFVDLTPPCNSLLHYYVTSFNITGSADSDVVSLLSAKCPPVAPVITAVPATETSISLTWTDGNTASTEEDGFEVWARPYPPGNWSKLVTLPANTVNYVHSDLLCGSNYQHKIVAFNAGWRTEGTPIISSTSVCTPPATPSDLAVESVIFFKTEVRLTWLDNSINEWGFKIEQQVGANWVEAANVGHNQTATHITGLTCETSYTFRIYAYNTQNSAYSATATGSTAVCDSKSPINFSATPVSQTRIDLAWDPPDPPEPTPSGYQIIRAVGLSRTHLWTAVANVAEPTHTYSDPGLTCGTTYFYSIRSVFPGPTYSLYTAPISAITVKCFPGAPRAIKAKGASQISVRVTWLPPESGDLDGYYLERAYYSLALGKRSWMRIATLGADDIYFDDNSMSCGTLPEYRIQAFNAGGGGSYSEEASDWTLPCTPAAPSGLHATGIQKTSLSLAWTDNSANEDGFRIERSGDGGLTWVEAGSTAADIQFFDDFGDLTCGRPYSYRVIAFNTGGEAATPILETLTLPCNPILSAAYGPQGVVTLRWTDPGQSTTLYNFWRAVHNGAWGWIGQVEAPQTSFRDLNVPCGADYDYYILAYNASGDSDFSDPVVVTADCQPTTVIDLVASGPTINTITLTWTASAGGQTGYVLMRSTDGQDNWQWVADLGAGATSYIDQNLPPGGLFYYRLWAVNLGGQVGSNVASEMTRYACLLVKLIK